MHNLKWKKGFFLMKDFNGSIETTKHTGMILYIYIYERRKTMT